MLLPALTCGLLSVVLSGCNTQATTEQITTIASPQSSLLPWNQRAEDDAMGYQRIDFSRFHPTYRFAGSIPNTWDADYSQGPNTIAVYDPALAGKNILEKTQIFIRSFDAGDFQTLTTVNVHSKEPLVIRGHSAVRYDIEKKEGIPTFANQPPWRSERHMVVDVRYSDSRPSVFYVYAFNPTVDPETIDAFLESLTFYNDPESYMPPIDQAKQRIQKKSFGMFITPKNSPVTPERFSGYHTGTDFEVSAEEWHTEIPVYAICGGPLILKSWSAGYGGVAVQRCQFGSDVITVLYGHLNVESIPMRTNFYIPPGELIGMLGESGKDTDGERKHLHLGIHRGASAVLAGYVHSEAKLKEWMDVERVLGWR